MIILQVLFYDQHLYNYCAANVIQLIADALDTMTQAAEFHSIDGQESLVQKIIALHLVYKQCHSEVLQFGQLVLHRPGILKSLSDMPPSDRTGAVSVVLVQQIDCVI